MNRANILMQLRLKEPVVLREFIRSAFQHEPLRCEHILAVADRAVQVCDTLLNHRHVNCCLKETECAALLHDIGYLPEISTLLEQATEYHPTGWHPVDGANFLRYRGEHRLATLIEGHGHSPEVSKLRGLAPMTVSNDIVAMIITYCDVQTDPNGIPVSYMERLNEIGERKGLESQEYKAHLLARNRIETIISKIDQLLAVPILTAT